MCGIAGILGRHKASDFDALFSAIDHRGPDATGIYRDIEVEIGMNRLAFRGADVALPIQDAAGVSAFNGQVYGWFGARGYKPIEIGISNEIMTAMSEDRTDGMYACSQYKHDSGELSLRTDPHFIKPLFYRHEPGSTSFCSEFAPLLRMNRNRIDMAALADLFAYGWYLNDRSWIRDISLVWRNDVKIGPEGVDLRPKPSRPSCANAPNSDQLCAAIRSSVERSIQGAGPIGLALSGGLDSSILAYELNDLGVEDLTCITVLSRDGDERLETLAELGLPEGAWRTWRHVKIEIDDDNFLTAFNESTLKFAQPTTMSSLPLYGRLADAAADAGVRALILGEGVDEYFGGYSSYTKISPSDALLAYYRHSPREQLNRTLFGEEIMSESRTRFEALYGGEHDLRAIEVQLRLTRLLLRSDVCLMARSIEGRVPFLHNDIPALAMALDWQDLVRGGGKAFLRHAYASKLGARALIPKVRFKAPDAMLIRCVQRPDLRARILAGAGSVFSTARVAEALELIGDPAGYDADITCLLLSLTFLVERGMFDGTGR